MESLIHWQPADLILEFLLRGKKEKSILEHRGSQTLEYWFIGYSQSYLQVHCSLFSHTFKILQIISKLYCKLDKSVSKICHYWHIVMFKNILQVINSPHKYRNSHPLLQCNWLISSIILFFNYYYSVVVKFEIMENFVYNWHILFILSFCLGDRESKKVGSWPGLCWNRS